MDTIIKVCNKTENFTVICNEVARRTDLSARAKGIYFYLMTLPPDWEIHKSEIYSHFTEGRDALNNAFIELENSGYIKKEEIREKGKFVAVKYTVYESTVNGKPVTEKPYTDNPHLLNTNFTNHLLTNNISTKEPPIGEADALPPEKVIKPKKETWYSKSDNAESLRFIKQCIKEDIAPDYVFTPAEDNQIKIIVDLLRKPDDTFDKPAFGDKWEKYMNYQEKRPKTFTTFYYRINEL